VSDAPRYSQLFESYPQLKSWSKSGSNKFAKLSGTSMSAAVTTGIVSLVLEASRGVNTEGALTPNAVKAVMQFTALPLSDGNGQRYDALTQGTGEVNARGAVSLALSINTAMPVGSDWLRTPLVPVTQIGGQALGWSQSLIWDDNIVWGTDALLSNGEQWDDNIVWGTDYACDPNDAGCENIVWGTLLECDDACENIVWGTAAELDNIVWGTAIGWAVDIVWGNRVVGLMGDDDNIVWGTLEGLDADNIVWGTFDGDNIVWGTFRGGENIVWGTFDLDLDDADNIVWGTLFDDDNIVWGTLFDSDNIVWGTLLKGGLQP
jgi:hypothetical protein